MRVDDPWHRSCSDLGCGDHLWVYAIGEAVHDILGDLVPDVADKSGHGQPGHRVTPGLAEGDSDQPRERTGRGECIQPGMLGIGNQRGRVDALSDPQLVPGNGLVPDDAQRRPNDARRDMGGVPVLDELPDALESGECRASQMTTAMPIPAKSSARSSP